MAEVEENNVKWGSQKWFDNKLKEQSIENPSSYFSHGENGYQIFRHKHLTQVAKDNLPTRSLNKILDVGCGTGHLVVSFKNKLNVPVGLGFDFVPGLIEMANRDYKSVEFRVSALPDLPLEEKTMDLIIASEVLYYLSQENQRKALENINKTLTNQGVFFLTSKVGGQYYQEEKFLKSTEGLFKIYHKEFIYNNFYNKLVFPLRAIQLIYQGTREKTTRPGKLGNLFKKYPFIKTNKIIGFFLWLGNFFCSPILKSESFPAFCHSISKKLNFGKSGSNIIVIFEKV